MLRNLSLKTATAIILAFTIVIILTGNLSAQETNSAINGEVKDANGALVVGAKITVINDLLGLQREAVTDERGFYTIPFLPAGTYTLTAELAGFGTVQVKNIALRASIDANVPIRLQPKNVAETVTVEADTNNPDATNATVKQSITNDQVAGLPVFSSSAGRSVLGTLPFLAPGVTPTAAFGGSSNSRGVNMSVNGSRPNSISYNLDGADNNDSEFNRAASPLPNPDALQEFTIITNNFQADLGRTSGAVINAVTKSGTDSFRGNVRYYLQDEALNARNFFALTRPVTHLDTFGGQIGGPVIIPYLYNGKGKTHFFFDTEFSRNLNSSPLSFDFFSLRERSGDFSLLPVAQQPKDPLTGQPFPGGIIPQNRISPIAKYYLSLVPDPNVGDRIVQRTSENLSQNKQYTFRFDQQLGKSDSLSATYFYNFQDSRTTSSTPPLDKVFLNETRNDSFSLRETHIFSPQLVNQFTFSFTKFKSRGDNESASTDKEPSEVGFTNLRRQSGPPVLPQVFISGSQLNFIIGNETPNDKTNWQIKDDVTLIRGEHSFKFGADFRNFRQNQDFTGTNGQFSFGNNPFGTCTAPTTCALADFLLGIPNAYTQSTGLSIDANQKTYSFYAMDDWRIRPNLTLNLGLRYELAPPVVEANNQVSAFRPGQISKIIPNAPAGLLYVGDTDPLTGKTIPRGGYEADKNNFAPRFGLAYSPAPESGWLKKIFHNDNTAIRIGFGIFYDQPTALSTTQFSYVQPFATSVSLTSATIRASGGTFANPWGTAANPFPLDVAARTFTGRIALRPIDPTFRTAYAYHYNLTVQRQLPAGLLLEIAYVGNNTFKLPLVRDLNEPVVGPGATTANVLARRPYTAFNEILSQESGGRSRYDGLQIQLSKRLAQGLTFNVSYVYGRAFDNGSNPLVGQGGNLPSISASASGVLLSNVRSFADQFNWARSENDRTHNFVLNYTYFLPKFKVNKIAGVFANGWQIGGITQIRSGLPLDIGQLTDTSLRGFSRGRADLVGQFQNFDPRQVQTFTVNGVARTGNYFFDPNGFAAVPAAAFPNQRVGNLARNVFDGPGLNLTSLTVAKRTNFYKENALELRLDINNLFNTPIFSAPSVNAGQSGFGIVTQAISPRTMQASVRISF